MERDKMKKKDPRGLILYKELIGNESVNKDYFNNGEDKITLESLLDSSHSSLESNKIKIKIMYSLRKHKLSVLDYYDISESYFNKYFYNMKLMKNEENKINKYMKLMKNEENK